MSRRLEHAPKIVFYESLSNGRVNAVFWLLVGGAALFATIGLFASHML